MVTVNVIFSEQPKFLVWSEVEKGQAVRSTRNNSHTYIKTTEGTRICLSDASGHFSVQDYQGSIERIFYLVDLNITVKGVRN